jgi:hypothetical protein
MTVREYCIATGVIVPRPVVPSQRTGDPSPQAWRDVATLRLDALARREIERERRPRGNP